MVQFDFPAVATALCRRVCRRGRGAQRTATERRGHSRRKQPPNRTITCTLVSKGIVLHCASLTVPRPATPDDLPAVAVLIARLNADPATQSLHCPTGAPRRIRAGLEQPDSFPAGWSRSFVLATDPAGELRAALGCQFDPGRTVGWLWGPWLPDARDWPVLGPALLTGLLDRLPASVRRIDAFLHTANHAGLRFLQSRGFAPGPVTHIYVAPRAGRAAAETPPCPELRAAHEVAFARLHADTFPASGSAPAEILLAGRDEEHVIFAATDGLRLLGSVCVSVNHAPLEGFIDYLAVKPALRGKGIGTRLLRTALRWIFDDRRLPQAALTVSDWRHGARRLYERAGFSLQASGIAARLKTRR